MLKHWGPWLLMFLLIAACSGVVVYNLPCNIHQRQEQQKIQQNSVLQANERHLGVNERCTLRATMTDDGWSSVELRTDPDRFYFEAEKANGEFETVERGSATLTTERECDRKVYVYKKGDVRPCSAHIIHIVPCG